MAQYVAQRDLGHLVTLNAEVCGERVDALLDARSAAAAEIPVAEVAIRERGLRGDPAGEGAFVQRHPHDDTDAVLGARGQQLLLRSLVKDVADALDGVYDTAAHQLEGIPRLVIVDGHAEQADLPRPLELLDGFQPVAAADPLVAPHVQLEQVERLETGSAEAGFQTFSDVSAWECLGRVYTRRRWPDLVFRRYLRGHADRQIAVLAHHLANDALTVAVAARGIDERDAEFDRPVQRAQ